MSRHLTQIEWDDVPHLSDEALSLLLYVIHLSYRTIGLGPTLWTLAGTSLLLCGAVGIAKMIAYTSTANITVDR